MATAENTTTETGNQVVVGHVAIIYGTVKAISADGTERLLTLNSPIFADDTIVTESDGRVSIVMADGSQTQIDLGRMSEVTIDDVSVLIIEENRSVTWVNNSLNGSSCFRIFNFNEVSPVFVGILSKLVFRSFLNLLSFHLDTGVLGRPFELNRREDVPHHICSTLGVYHFFNWFLEVFTGSESVSVSTLNIEEGVTCRSPLFKIPRYLLRCTHHEVWIIDCFVELPRKLLDNPTPSRNLTQSIVHLDSGFVRSVLEIHRALVESLEAWEVRDDGCRVSIERPGE